MGKLLTATQILASKKKIDYVDVPVPEWTPEGEPEPMMVRLRALSAKEAIDFSGTMDGPAKKTSIVRIIIKTAIGEDNQPLFTESQLQELMDLSMKAFDRLSTEAVKLNKLEKKAEKEVKNDSSETT